MPPFLPRKRSTPPVSPRPVLTKRARLADALDVEATNNVPSLKQTKTFSLGSDDSSSDSSLSDVDSNQFEDVSIHVKQPTVNDEDGDTDEVDEEDEDVVWEDAGTNLPTDQPIPHVPMANGSIEITLRDDQDDVVDYSNATNAGSGKKGPSKREKQARILTHQLHVQFLLLHNAIRNKWIGDKEVQSILIKQLPPPILKEVEKWKRASGLLDVEPASKKSSKGKRRRQMNGDHERNQRDWGQPSQRLEAGRADMSHGDPIISLMKVLSAYWKKRFAITAPGLRKRGYGTKQGLRQDIASFRNDEHDPEKHGEKIKDIATFRQIARTCRGSRDVGAQLFTALIRGLGIEARLVASLQPSGYGWTKAEQMLPRKLSKPQAESDSSDDEPVKPLTKRSTIPQSEKTQPRNKSRPNVISLDTDEDGASNSGQEDTDVKDDESIVDVTPSMPKQQKAKYDRDLVFPIYWTEAISPITNKVIAVSPLVLEAPVATTPDALSAFEPKGAKAEKGRQVMAYVVAYSDDSTAKDVTVRYLRKQIWPGKTKGFRFPLEKIPIYDKRGKIKRYEDYDWFKHILSPYTRSDTKRRPVDDVEDSTDLVPQQPEKKNDEGVDTLQSLKSSADFVLERFLRREEALRPGAKSVRMFASGKGDKYREEPVYRRADVERCLTAESWHKEGRRPLLGETPMKMVPVRAVTLTRKREAEEHERQYGEKQMQGLYAWDQTEWIIPAPIQDGIIPKNAYGNMDCFVPSMVPEGAVHIPLKGTVRICKRLDIDFAEAVTGFEFGNKRAVPVCTGVVVARENEKVVKDAWKQWNEEQRRKEETKMEKLVLDLWRKFVLGLRIRERVQDMYGEEIGVIQDEPTGYTREDAIAIDDEDEQGGGGFVNEADDEEMGGGFLLPQDENTQIMEDLVMDDLIKPSNSHDDLNGPGLRHSSHLTEDLDELKYDSDSDLLSSDLDSPNDFPRLNDESVHDEDNAEQKTTSFTKPVPSQARYRTTATKQNSTSVKETPSDGRKTVGPRTQRAVTKAEHNDVSNSDNSSSAESPDEIPVHESEDDDDDDEEEIYTPRPTRTRTRTGARTAAPTTSQTKPEPKPKPKSTSTPAPAQSSQVAKTRSRTSKIDIGTSDGNGRGSRGRPRKNESALKPAPTSKRSTRLVRKESTLVTSPYFERDQDDDDDDDDDVD